MQGRVEGNVQQEVPVIYTYVVTQSPTVLYINNSPLSSGTNITGTSTLLIQRVKLSSAISSTKNSIIGYLKREGLYSSLPESNDSFSEKRREAIKEIRFENQKDLVLRTMMDRLEFLEK